MAILAVVAAAVAVALTLPPSFALPGARAPSQPPLLPMPWVAAVSAAVAVLLLVPLPLGPPGAAMAAVLALRFVRRLEPAAARRRRARLEKALPLVVDLMATCLAAGASPGGALGQIASALESPMRDELRTYSGRLALGADPVTVWSAMATHAELGPLGRALQRSSQTGASVADALGRLAIELRAARRTTTEAEARTVEVKASLPLGLCLLPAFVLIGVVPMVAGSFSLTFLGT
jgi:Flp pilus assembly protein TadB